MYPVAEQVGASRIVKGVSIPHPCGDPSLPAALDAQLRREIVSTALKALEAKVESSTVFTPKIATQRVRASRDSDRGSCSFVSLY